MSDPAVAAYEPRDIHFVGVRQHDGWRLKHYTIQCPDQAPTPRVYDSVWPLVAAALPQPPVAPGRPGAGIVITHHGRGVHYVVLAWWANENELPVRLWTRGFAPDDAWRPGAGEQSFCVWDLEVLWAERCAWVETAMDPDGGGVDAYLARGAPPATYRPAPGGTEPSRSG